VDFKSIFVKDAASAKQLEGLLGEGWAPGSAFQLADGVLIILAKQKAGSQFKMPAK
jgi:hypothetical protein